MATRSKMAMFLALALAICATAGQRAASAHDPKDANVQALAGRGVAFLKTSGIEKDTRQGRLGGLCLVAQAIYAFEGDPDEPTVRAAVAACRTYAESGAMVTDHVGCYELGFAINFLVKLAKSDPTLKPVVAALWAQLASLQRPDGGWSYPGYKTGDTSQTQYAAFSMWEVEVLKIAEVPDAAVDALCNWLMRTQDPSGSWGYQGVDPGIGNFNRVPQERVTHSVAAAGAGSLYITADMLGLSKKTREEIAAPASKDGVFKEVKKDQPNPVPAGQDAGRKRATGIDTNRLRGALNDADRWWGANFAASSSRWQHYYLYGLERYHSFREKVEGLIEREPRWYNEGVDLLMSTQRPDGSWGSGEGASAAPLDTSFAVLFLLRGTKVLIGDVTTEGTLRGGVGIPTDLKNLRLTEDGKLIAPSAEDQLKDLTELLASMDERTDLDVDSVDLSQFVIKKEERQTQFDQLVAKVLGNPSYQGRLLGVKILTRERENLEHVPVLIYALSDPDPRVVMAARDALRLISRKIDGFGPPDKATPDQVRIAQQAWKRWFLSIRPDARFEF